MQKSRFNTHPDGFSLIEVALAMLVIAIGIPALLGLLGSGLNMNKTSQDDTIIGTFAQAYFNAVKSVASTNWQTIVDANIGTLKEVPGIRSEEFSTSQDFKLSGGPHSYDLKVQGSGQEIYQLKYEPDVDIPADKPNTARLELKIWPGKFGSSSSSDATTFYTEIYRLD
jgi:prepilin-type N-terminal cleavage/methylation domain-containing protein